MSQLKSVMWHGCGKPFINRVRSEEGPEKPPEFQEVSKNESEDAGILRSFQESSPNSDKERKDFGITQIYFRETRISFTEIDTPG